MTSDLLLLIMVVFGIAILLRVEFFFYILYLLFGVYLLGRLWARRAVRQLAHARIYTDRIFLGESVAVELEIVNRGLVPIPWLRISERLPIELASPGFYRRVESLGPRERLLLRYELDGRRRGYYRLGPLYWSSGDVFGIGELEAKEQDTRADHLIVYPEIIPLHKLGLPSHTPFGSLPSKERIFEDPTRVMGVRDYLSGDSLRHVDWKTSAATGRLQVKQYQPAISLETTIYLNLNEDAYYYKDRRSATELAIVVAASLANHLVARQQSVGLVTNGRDPLSSSEGDTALPARHGRDHLMSVLDVLARVESRSTGPFAGLLRRESAGLPWGSTTVAITPTETEDLFPSLIQMQRRGFNVVLVLVAPTVPFRSVQQRAKRLHMQAYRITRREELDVWQ